MDLMEEPIGTLQLDAAWCRWVACFVTSPAKLVANVATALRPGGAAVFHEYIDYATWRLAPRRPAFESFVQRVMETRGFVSDGDVQAVKTAGYTDGQIAETIAYIGLATYSNFFNHVNGTELDFPAAPAL